MLDNEWLNTGYPMRTNNSTPWKKAKHQRQDLDPLPLGERSIMLAPPSHAMGKKKMLEQRDARRVAEPIHGTG